MTDHSQAEESPRIPTLPRRQLARILRDGRDTAGLSIARAAMLVDLSKAALQRYETGRNARISRPHIRALCELYEFDGERTKFMLELAEAARQRSQTENYGDIISDTFQLFIGLETIAVKQFSYSLIVPGLLQTRAYAEAITRKYVEENDELTVFAVDRLVNLRIDRQRAIKRSVDPMRLEAIIDEAALYQQVGNMDTMREQLGYLLDMSQSPSVTLRIHPFSAGFPLGIPNATFMILDFPKAQSGEIPEPPLAFLESSWSDAYMNDAKTLEQYMKFAESVRKESYSQSDTRKIIRTVIKRYEK
ncbi:helix-turn-helix domain-containing protein [Nocardia wallacei]|uniref:helix-turn-helix domain-containing protein n=1 Tax=Nocardia wallacei TaxID=480035 RepID=UPI002458D458|nr:helix-turn-helix transcriptional regulator [Nocardia wallacei]